MEKSQNGWKASSNQREINIVSFPIRGAHISIRCQALAGVILAAFAEEFHKQVEPIDRGQLDDWGYAYRPVRGQTTGLSNHASGTAIDLNATKHPLGKAGTFTKEQVKIINQLCSKYGIRWGGGYIHRPDEMHFEITETPEQVKARIIKLGIK